MVKQMLVLNDQVELETLQGMDSLSMFRLVMPTNEEVYFVKNPNSVYALTEGETNTLLALRSGIQRRIYFVGDSQTLNGVDMVFRGAESTNYEGIAASLIGVEWDAKSETSGVLEYRAVDTAFRWTIAGDTAGAWTPITRAGRYVFPSGTANKGVTISIRNWSTLPVENKTIAVTLSGQLQLRVNPSGAPTAQGHVMGYYGLPYRALGASGARTIELVEYLGWLQDQMPERGVAVVRIGTNDVGASLAATDIITNAYTAFDALRLRGHKLCICGIAPRWVNSAPGTPLSPTQYTTLHLVNKAYQGYCSLYATDCEYVDCYNPSVDPTASDARPIAGALVDYVHDGYWSSKKVADKMITAISRWLSPSPKPALGDPSVVNPQVAWMQGVGTNGSNSTGDVPYGFTVSSNDGGTTVVNTLVINTGGDNSRTLVSTITVDTTASSKVTYGMPSITAAPLVDKEVYFEADIAISFSDIAPIVNPYLYVNLSPSPGIRTDYYITRGDEPSRRISLPIKIPATATTLVPVIDVTIPAGLGTMELRITNFIVKF